MAVYKLVTSILIILVETCIANIDSIEFKLGDRNLRVPITPQTQGNLANIKRLDLPDTEDLTHVHVHPQQGETHPLLRRLPPIKHHIPIQKTSKEYPDPVLSNIYDNYPLPNNIYPPHQAPTNQYHGNQYSQSYHEQQLLEQLYPKQYHQPDHYHSHSELYYPNEYHQYPQLKPNFPQVAQLQSRRHSPPYFSNHAYPSANYISDNFHQSHLLEHYVPRSHFDKDNKYARYNPHIYKPQSHLQNPWEYSRNRHNPRRQGIDYDPIYSQNPAHSIISPTKNNATQVRISIQNHENVFNPQSSLPRRISHKSMFDKNAARPEQGESLYSRSSLLKHYVNSHPQTTASRYLEQDKSQHSRSNLEEYSMGLPPAVAAQRSILHPPNILPDNTMYSPSKSVQAQDLLAHNRPIVIEQYSTSIPTKDEVISQDISKLAERLNDLLPPSTTETNILPLDFTKLSAVDKEYKVTSPTDITSTSKNLQPVTTASVTTDTFVTIMDNPTLAVASTESTTVAPILETLFSKGNGSLIEDTTVNVPDNLKSPDKTKVPVTFVKLYTHIDPIKADSRRNIPDTTTESTGTISSVLITTTYAPEILSSVQKEFTDMPQLNHKELSTEDTINTSTVIPSVPNRRNDIMLYTLAQFETTELTTINETTRPPQQDATTDIPLAFTEQEIEITTSGTSSTVPLTITDALEQYVRSETTAQVTTTPVSVTNMHFIKIPTDNLMKTSIFKGQNNAEGPSYTQHNNNITTDSMKSNSATDTFIQYATTDKLVVNITTSSSFDIQMQEISTTTMSSTLNTVKSTPEISLVEQYNSTTEISVESATNNSSDIISLNELSTTKNPELFLPVSYMSTEVPETKVDLDSFIQDTTTDTSISTELNTTTRNLAEHKNIEKHTFYTTTAGVPTQIARRPCKKHHRHKHSGRKGSGSRRRRRRSTTVRPSSTILSTPVTRSTNTGTIT